MINFPTTRELEERELLSEAIVTTTTLAASVAKQTTVSPALRIALQDAVEALERLREVGR